MVRLPVHEQCDGVDRFGARRDAGRPHHGRQARRPLPPQRRSGARRVRARGGEAARQGQEHRPGADRHAARPRLVHRAGRAGQAPLDQLRAGEEQALRRRRRHRLRHRRRPSGVRVQPGRDDLRRVARPGVRREDRQGDGPGDQDRQADRGHQRGRWRAHPGGCRVARALRRDLQPQRARVRRHPADLADHGRERGRARLLPRADRLRGDGRPDLAHVHHRPGRDQDRHRRGRRLRGPGRRADAQHQVRQRALPRRRRAGRDLLRQGVAVLPAVQQPVRPAGVRRRRGGRRLDRRLAHRRATASWTRWSRTRPTSPTTSTR